ncbi:MAG TPA: alpha/beta hydrolase [Anaerolineales bacterium]
MVSKLEGKPKLRTQYLKLPEGTLAYSDYGGDGEPVLMLPGMGALRSEYRYLAPALHEAGYRAITMDLRGQGDSSVPWERYDVPSVGEDILALIEDLDAGPAHVIATSFSPAPAIWAAVERPECIRSLALIGAFARDPEPNAFMKAATWFMMNNPWRAQTWRAFYRTLYPTRKPEDFEAYLDELSANLSQPGRFEAVKAFSNAQRQPSEQRLPEVKAPALVVMGTKDPDFPNPAEEGRYLAEKMGGKLVLIEGAGHYPQTEMPEETAAPVLDFLRQV